MSNDDRRSPISKFLHNARGSHESKDESTIEQAKNRFLGKADSAAVEINSKTLHVVPNIEEFTFPEIKSAPEYAFDAIKREITDFQEAYAEQSENVVLGSLAAFGREILVQISEIHLSSQYFVIKGYREDGSETRLIQHYTDFSMLLTTAKPFVKQTKRGIGFTAGDVSDE